MAFIVFPGQYGVSTNKTRYSANGTTWSSGTIPEVTSGANNWSGIGKIGGKYFAGRRGSTVGGSSTDGITFTSYTLPIATGNPGVMHNSALYYSSGSSVAYSSNGTSWTTVTLPNASGGTICSNGSRLVTISATTSVTSYSDNNGATWTAGGAMPAATSPYGSHIIWNGSVFVATTAAGVAKSSDGITWTGDTTTSQYTWGVATKPSTGIIVVVYSPSPSVTSNTCKYSTNNGSTWNNATLPATMLWRDVAYDPNLGLFATFDYATSNTATSPDGITWTARTGYSDGNQNFGMMADPLTGTTYTLTATAIATSTGTKSHTVGTTRTINASATVTSSATFASVISAPKPFIIFPDTFGGGAAGAKYSMDGITWFNTTMPASGTNWVPAQNKLAGYIIAVPQSNGTGNWARSIDGGATWQAMTGFGLSNAASSGANNGSMVIFTAGSSYAKSTNGSTWTTGTLPNASGGSGTAGAIAFGGSTSPGIFVTVAGSNFAYSTDGTTWTGGTLPNACGGYITWNGSVFCAISGNFTSTSPDGITWTAQTRATTYGGPWNIASKVVSGTGGTIVIIYLSGTCHYSTNNGVTWNTATIPGSTAWLMVSYNSALGLFCAAPYSASSTVVATSPDGITWTSRTAVSFTAEAQNMYGYQDVVTFSTGTTYNQTANATATSALTFVRQSNNKKSVVSTSNATRPGWNIFTTKVINSVSNAFFSTGGLTQFVTAAYNSVSTSILSRFISTNKNTTSTNITIKQLKANTTKVISSTNTATNAKVVQSIRVGSSASIPVLLKATAFTKFATSVSNAVFFSGATLTKLVNAIASVANTANIQKTISWTKSLAQPSIANSSKAALLNKNVLITNSTSLTRAMYATKNVVVNSTSVLLKAFAKTFNAASTLVPTFVKNFISTKSTGLTGVAIYNQNISAARKATSVNQAFITKTMNLLRSIVVISQAFKSETFEMVIELLVASNASLQKALTTTKIAASTTIASIAKQIAHAFSTVVSASHATYSLTIGKIASALSIATAYKIEMFELVLRAASTAIVSFRKAMSITKSINVASIASVITRWLTSAPTLVAFYVTIKDFITRGLVQVTVPNTLVLDTTVTRTIVQLPVVERTVIRL